MDSIVVIAAIVIVIVGRIDVPLHIPVGWSMLLVTVAVFTRIGYTNLIVDARSSSSRVVDPW